MNYKIIISILFSFQMVAVAQTSINTKFTYSQTLDEIDRLTHGSNQKIRRIYKEKVLHSEEWIQESLNYVRNYYPDGKLKSEGLMIDGEKVGFWNYFSSNGIKIKTSDYSTLRSRWFGETAEPYDAILKETLSMADSFLVARLGPAFAATYIRYSGSTGYLCKSNDEHEHRKDWLDIQECEPVKFEFKCDFLLGDTERYHAFDFQITTNGEIQFNEGELPNYGEADVLCYEIPINGDSANRIASNYGFHPIPFKINVSKDGLYWEYRDHSGDCRNNTMKQLIINACTGETKTATWSVDYNLCSESNINSKEDAIKPKDGYKQHDFAGLRMDIPNYWIELEEYGKSDNFISEFSYMGQGDTLFFYITSHKQPAKILSKTHIIESERPFAKLKNVGLKNCVVPDFDNAVAWKEYENCLDLERKIRDEEWRAMELDLAKRYHYYDSLELLSMERTRLANEAERRKAEGVKIANEFKSLFPEGKMQGRNFDLEVVLPFNGRGWDLYLKIYSTTTNFTTYNFEAKNLTDQRYNRIMEVFKTARFVD